MGERLKADLRRIEMASKQIRKLAGEFENATRLADGYAGALGSAELARALNAFAGNWSIHRTRLIDDLSKESGLADAAVQAYRGTDEELAKALAKQETAASG